MDNSGFYGACSTNEGCKYAYNVVQVHIPHPIQAYTATSSPYASCLHVLGKYPKPQPQSLVLQ